MAGEEGRGGAEQNACFMGTYTSRVWTGAQLGVKKYSHVYKTTLGVRNENSGSLFANKTAKILEVTESFCFFA
jgi:hypothetical protein